MLKVTMTLTTMADLDQVLGNQVASDIEASHPSGKLFKKVAFQFLRNMHQSSERDSIESVGKIEILPGLYIGNFKDARDAEQLSRNKVTHILSVHDSARPMMEIDLPE
ncbi:dual specificity protein phosphatase 22-like protein [Cricetulus griseus]|nr:dual specificity protein phosphatase 22-like protein [Cricetulus griseus]